MIHPEPHPKANQPTPFKIRFAGTESIEQLQVEDWWDRVSGGLSWKDSPVIAAIMYAQRIRQQQLPEDDEVVYGKIGKLGYLVHVSEIL